MRTDENRILSDLIDAHIQIIVNKVVCQIRRVPKKAMISNIVGSHLYRLPN